MEDRKIKQAKGHNANETIDQINIGQNGQWLQNRKMQTGLNKMEQREDGEENSDEERKSLRRRDEQNDSDEDRSSRRKKPLSNVKYGKKAKIGPFFACHFHKRNPIKYNREKEAYWTCQGPGFSEFRLLK